MTIAQIIAFLAPFEAMLKPELLQLEAAGIAELNSVIAAVTSPDLKALLTALASALDSFSQVEINKLP